MRISGFNIGFYVTGIFCPYTIRGRQAGTDNRTAKLVACLVSGRGQGSSTPICIPFERWEVSSHGHLTLDCGS